MKQGTLERPQGRAHNANYGGSNPPPATSKRRLSKTKAKRQQHREEPPGRLLRMLYCRECHGDAVADLAGRKMVP